MYKSKSISILHFKSTNVLMETIQHISYDSLELCLLNKNYLYGRV